MAMAIVDLLEVIEIQEEDHYRRGGFLHFREPALEVVEAGEGITQGAFLVVDEQIEVGALDAMTEQEEVKMLADMGKLCRRCATA